jgi:hypothetical protein
MAIFIVAWTSGGLHFDVFARRFDSSGSAVATEFQVNPPATESSSQPAVARDADGDFVIAWTSYDGSASGVFARRFNSSGGAKGSEFQVNDYTIDQQSEPTIDLDQDGDFVIAWNSARRGLEELSERRPRRHLRAPLPSLGRSHQRRHPGQHHRRGDSALSRGRRRPRRRFRHRLVELRPGRLG